MVITTELKIRTRTKSLNSPIQSEDQILEIASELFSAFFQDQKTSGDSTPRLRRVGIKVSEFVSDFKSKANTLENYIG